MEPTSGSLEAPTLLTLPFEIRELIYHRLVDLAQAPPDLFEEDLEDLRYPRRYTAYNHSLCPPTIQGTGRYYYQVDDQRIYFPFKLPTYSLLPILQTCSKIRAEFQSFLNHLSKTVDQEARSSTPESGLAYVLDVDARGRELFPLWRSLPLPSEKPYNNITELRINYTFHDFILKQPLDDRWYYCNHTDQKDQDFNILQLLNLLLWHGPQGFYVDRLNSVGGGMRINDGQPDGGTQFKAPMPTPVTNVPFSFSFEPSFAIQKPAGRKSAAGRRPRARGGAFQPAAAPGTSEIYQPGGRCQPFFKRVVFNTVFKYDRDLANEVAKGEFRPASGPGSYWEWMVPGGSDTLGVTPANGVTLAGKLDAWKIRVCEHHAHFFKLLVTGGFMDGMTEKVVVLCDGTEKWGDKTRGTDCISGIGPDLKLSCEHHVKQRERRTVDTAALHELNNGRSGHIYECFRWGPIHNFQRTFSVEEEKEAESKDVFSFSYSR
ncbi:hypothetical protein H072_4680 [Dactylellina haptotyla CBS 200.50]|uniref:F-box domain-containing protein n=1 Tax=Dactylellina haptotyla (strain CBS 200.50) TaxID=1284197 RepID=S8C1G9_DACHA|nr:hypothetical protein H072_4680 [Dactylellina haptotyla CBS 200.50]